MATNYVIQWIDIYPVDKTIHLWNNILSPVLKGGEGGVGGERAAVGELALLSRSEGVPCSLQILASVREWEQQEIRERM